MGCPRACTWRVGSWPRAARLGGRRDLGRSRRSAEARIRTAVGRGEGRALETFSATQMIVAPIAPHPSAKAQWLTGEDYPAEAPP